MAADNNYLAKNIIVSKSFYNHPRLNFIRNTKDVVDYIE